MGRADVGPFAEVGLAENHRASLAQAGDQRGVAVGDIGGQCEAARGRGQGAGDLDIVLDQDRHSGERTAQAAGVDSARLVDRGGVERDDGVDRGLDPLDTRDGGAGRLLGGAGGEGGRGG